MNRITVMLIFLFILGLPMVSAGEGTMDTGSPEADRLPITRVTLYSAGLAQIVHETTVTDDEVLLFPVEHKDLNDILKSLVLEDLSGGTVDAVSFDSGNILSQALADMRINPSGSPGLKDFLLRTQGEEVTVTTPYGTFSGRIFSVEEQSGMEGPETFLNLMDNDGIRAVDISNLQSLRFEDYLLQDEMNRALELIARSRVKSTRLLKLSFKGSGDRTVRLSYIRAVPLWKTSYRIALSEEGIPRLEGWALVQNTGSLPWENVRLGFVAGSPNAFTMDLSTPRYVHRQSVDIAPDAPIGATEYDKGYAPAPSLMAKESYSRSSSALYEEEVAADYLMEKSYQPAPVATQATGSRTGNFYRYDVKRPVTVEARSSAMIPILQESEVGRALGVYDPSYDLVFKGIRLENDTEAHWAAGPITILEGRYYGGDALMPEMIPGSSRLLTYAVHGSMEVQKSSSQSPRRIVRLKMVDGILHRTDKIERETLYHMQGKEKELILIHPKEAGWELTDHPEIEEETPGEYRFTLKEWKEPASVREEYTISEQFSLNGFRRQDYSVYLEWSGLSPAMTEAFKEMSRQKSRIESINTEIRSLNSGLSRMERDQNRVRENMKVLDMDSDLYKQYARQLSRQEEEIQKMNRDIGNQQTLLKKAEAELKEYIASLDI